MANEFFKAGGQPGNKQGKFVPIWVGSLRSGLVTNRSPLIGSTAPRLMEKFYGTSGDLLIDGSNVEISSRFTLMRRYGNSIYNVNTGNSAGINSFYEFRLQNGNIQVLQDCNGPNLVPDSNGTGLTWQLFANFFFNANNGWITGGAFEVTGNGSPSSFQVAKSQLITVVPGTQYTISGYIDATHVTAGPNPEWAVFDPNLQTNYASPNQAPGVVGRVSQTFTVPAGVTTVVVIADTSNSTIANGQTLFFSDPQLEVGATATGYKPSNIYTAVLEITNPNSNIIFSKSPGAGQTYFQGVLNTLFMANGVDLKKFAYTTNTWQSGVSYSASQVLTYAIGSQVQPGYTILDSNRNLQVLVQAGTAGSSQPVWSTTRGAFTADGTAGWRCYGSPVSNWGIVAPSVAPSPGNASLNNPPYPTWSANTFYAPTAVQIVDGANHIQQVTTAGTTGGSIPTFNDAGGTTNDGSVVWTDMGTAAWQANHAYATGAIINTGSYNVNNIYMPDFDGGGLLTLGGAVGNRLGRVRGYRPISLAYNDCFICVTAGTSGGSAPGWMTGFGSQVTDGTVAWKNIGSKITWNTIGANTAVSIASKIQDSNGNVQMPTVPGKSGSSAPAWNSTQGAVTSDNAQAWSNGGPLAAAASGAAATGTWVYGYAFKNSIANTVSSLSPLSAPILMSANAYVAVQGQGSADPQCDTIVIFRTTQGSSSPLFWLGEIANVGNATFTFIDTFPDSALNQFISAPVNGVNNPPPAGLVHLTYHLNRVWGNVGNIVYYSNPLTTTFGSGTEQFPNGSNYFVYPSTVTRLEPTSSGLLVFTTSDIYLISGQGTTTSILFSYPFIPGVGLLSWNGLTKIGSTFYLFTASKKLISLDPSAGFQEPGMPIGDKLMNFNPANVYVTWHDGGSTDTALFVADGATGWYRLTMNANASVEAPTIWSAFANITGGCKAVQSVEVSPGNKQLLIGPGLANPNSVLKRDPTVFTDNGTTYTAYATIGSIVLAEPGQMAQVGFIAADAVRVGSAPAVSVIYNEAFPYFVGSFLNLPTATNDPPRLAASTSLYMNRYYTNQISTPPWCRHMQTKISWPAENFQNELLSIAIYGAVWVEK